jgi:hypothetical protein
LLGGDDPALDTQIDPIHCAAQLRSVDFACVCFHSFVELMSNRIALAAAVFLSFSIAAQSPAQSSPPINWESLTTETVNVLADYIKVNTTNPPGNEIEAARFLKRILDREGIEAQILDTVELAGRRGANLYARLRSNGSKKAIALVHHMDVVPATQSAWSVDAFAGVVKDGYVWGRGAIDMKGFGIVQLMAMIAIKRSGMPLTRDIVYIANADEELGSTGALVFVQRHPELLRDVEYLMTEGGGNEVHDGSSSTTASGSPRSGRIGSAFRSRARRRTHRGRRSSIRFRD